MKKTSKLFAFAIILILTLMFSCGGGGGGGVDNAMEDTSFSIGYNANGAESGTAPAAQQGNGKEVLSVSANSGNLAKGGYLFDGWNTSSDGSGADYAPGALYNGKNIILYAKWTRLFNYSVNAVSPAPSLDGAQLSPVLPSVTITGLTPRGMTQSNIEIPGSIDGYPVSSIGVNAFEDCWNLAEVIIPDSITNIGDNAFNGCTNLSEVKMQGIEPPALGTGVFNNCSAIIGVPIESFDGYIAKEGWSLYSSNLVGYSTITYTVTFDDQEATTFVSPSNKEVVPPAITVGQLPISPVKTGYIFGGWYTEPNGAGTEFTANTIITSNITVYAKWNSYKYIVTFDTGILPGSCYINSFQRNKVIETKLVESPCLCVESLPPDPEVSGVFFAGWYTGLNGSGDLFTSLTEVTENITIHARWVYYSYTKQVQTGIEITGLTSGCNASKIEIPEYINGIPVISIGENAFYKKTSITSVKLGNGIKTIGRCAFYECENLTEINLPNSLTNIKDFAFSDCAKLKGISLPKNLINLGYCSFQNCKNIKDICLPGCLNTNHANIFANSGLTNVTIEEGVKTIPACMFYGCRINSIEIPSTVTAIKERAFDSCALLTVRVRAAIPPSIDSYIFTNCNSLKNIYVPFDSVTIYKGANYWKKYADKIKGYNE